MAVWRIGPYDFKVQRSPYKAQDHYGKTSFPECKVQLNITGSPALDAHTMVHEMLHCILSAHGYVDLNADEALVDALSMHLVNLLELHKSHV